MLRCADCATNWSDIVKELRDSSAYVYPLLYHSLFQGVREYLLHGKAYLDVGRFVSEGGERKYVNYVHIPVADLTHDLVLVIQWTGQKRFNAEDIKDTIYEVRYSKDIRRYRSSLESCCFIHTHGRFKEIKASYAREMINKYMTVKSALWRYVTNAGCEDIAGFAYSNNTSLSLIGQDYCIDNSIGFVTGKIKLHGDRVTEGIKGLKNMYIFLARDLYENHDFIYKYIIDAVLIAFKQGAYENLSISRKKLEVYSIPPLQLGESGMYIMIRPKGSSIFKPLIIGKVPRKNVALYLSAHALIYALVFAILDNTANNGERFKIPKEIVQRKYERIVSSPSGTLGIRPLDFEEVLNLCYPIIHEDSGKIYVTSTKAAIGLLTYSNNEEDYIQQLIIRRSTSVIRRPFISIGMRNIIQVLARGCSLIF